MYLCKCVCLCLSVYLCVCVYLYICVCVRATEERQRLRVCLRLLVRLSSALRQQPPPPPRLPSQDRNLYGRQRLWGAIGFGSMVFLSGAIIASTGSFLTMYLQHAILTLAGIFYARSMVENVQPKHTRTDDAAGQQQDRNERLEQALFTIDSDTDSDTAKDSDSDGNNGRGNEDDADDDGVGNDASLKESSVGNAGAASHSSNQGEETKGGGASSSSSRSSSRSSGDGTNTAATKTTLAAPGAPREPAVVKPNVVDAFRVVVQDVDAIIFFFIIVVAGFGVGVIETFLFIFMEQLGGSETVQGFGRLVTCLSEVSCSSRVETHVLAGLLLSLLVPFCSTACSCSVFMFLYIPVVLLAVASLAGAFVLVQRVHHGQVWGSRLPYADVCLLHPSLHHLQV